MSSPNGATLPPPVPPEHALARLLPPDVDLDRGWRHEAAASVWHGVVWGRLGRGDLAFAHLDRVRSPSLWPWIAAERGRLLRELGLHREAEALEFPALLEAQDAVDAAMLRVSLVADAVGLRDRDRAQRRLRAAREAVMGLDDSPRAARQRLRLTGVEIEMAFLVGAPVDLATAVALPVWVDGAASPSWPPDHAHGSDFHRAKALLFGGIVHHDLRLLDVAARTAPPVLLWAVELARADRQAPGALDAARAAWARITPPPQHARAVETAPTGRRFAAMRSS